VAKLTSSVSSDMQGLFQGSLTVVTPFHSPSCWIWDSHPPSAWVCDVLECSP
jgi:hypothetical protein